LPDPNRRGPLNDVNPRVKGLMISLPLIMIGSLASFFGVMVDIAGTDRRPRGVRRA